MPDDRRFYKPEIGVELQADGERFDVPEWRDGITTRLDEQTQKRNGQEHQRVYDPDVANTLKEILAQLKIMNTHFELITDEAIDES